MPLLYLVYIYLSYKVPIDLTWLIFIIFKFKGGFSIALGSEWCLLFITCNTCLLDRSKAGWALVDGSLMSSKNVNLFGFLFVQFALRLRLWAIWWWLSFSNRGMWRLSKCFLHLLVILNKLFRFNLFVLLKLWLCLHLIWFQSWKILLYTRTQRSRCPLIVWHPSLFKWCILFRILWRLFHLDLYLLCICILFMITF